MSDAPVVLPGPVAVPPAPKLTAIQILEQEIGGFIKQREVAISNVHAVEGAIQATQHLIAKLKAEEAKAANEVGKLLGEAETEIKKGISLVEKL